jgi:DNA-binding transcriptional LysR family regulator
MDRFHLITVFAAVAESQSFAGGARKIGLSAPAVTRAIAELENDLQVRLLTRTTRYVRLTDAGKRYFEDIRRILADFNDANAAVSGISHEPKGCLTVTAPALFGRIHLIPIISDYLQRFPDMTVSAVLLDRIVNLLEEEIDIGIRIGELPDSEMKAIKVGRVRCIVCASPTYLNARGRPVDPYELERHTLIASAAGSWPPTEWRFAMRNKTVLIKINPRLIITTNDGAIEAALQHLGLVRLLSYQVEPFIENGQLEPVLDAFELPPLPIHLVHRENRLAMAKVRSFIDFLVPRLQAKRFLLKEGEGQG